MGEYKVRPYRASDQAAFLSLYRQVFGDEADPAWFDWKYGENPFVDHVPIYVAESDGDLVGARPFLAMRMAVDERTHLALQPGDAMVAEDHRRRGLFTRMTEAAIERYHDGDPAFFFNFPGTATLPGNLKLGWELVGRRPTYYRVQDPQALASVDSRLQSLAATLASPTVSVYNTFRSGRSAKADLTVEHFETPPVRALADIAVGPTPGIIRARRDRDFYEWRFGNPAWQYEAYVGSRDGDPVAAVVAGRSCRQGFDLVKVTDAVGFGTGESGTDEMETLLRAVVSDHGDPDLIAAPPSLPQHALARTGFLSDGRRPLRYVTSQTTLVARQLGHGLVIDGVSLLDEDRWELTFVEEDTS